MEDAVEESVDSGLLDPRQKRIHDCKEGCSVAIKVLKAWWKLLVLVLTPFVLLPFPLALSPLADDQAADAAYVILIMAVYWVTEACPIVATSLLPLVLFPALGVLDAADVALTYFNDTTVLFMGGLIVAVAVEKWDLHKRLGILVLMLVGSRPVLLLLGFMVMTAFLSMWLSNTATTAMMLPIAISVIKELGQCTDPPRSAAADQTQESESQISDETSAANHDQAMWYRSYSASEELPTRVPLSGNRTDRLTVPVIGERTDRLMATFPRDDVKYDLAITDEPQGLEGSLHVDGDGDLERSTHSSSGLGITSLQQSTRLRSGTALSTNAGVNFAAELEDEGQPLSDTVVRLSKGLVIGIAFAANIGGVATLTGTAPNLVLTGIVSNLFSGSNEINFLTWMFFGLPTAVVAVVLTWVWLALVYCDDVLGFLKKRLCRRMTISVVNRQRGKAVIREQYRKLGPMKYAEMLVLLSFIVLALLWFLREPRFIPGWGDLFPQGENGNSFVSDGTTAIFIVFLLFILPSLPCIPFAPTRRRPPDSCTICKSCRRLPKWALHIIVCGCCWRKPTWNTASCIAAGRSDRLLDWTTVHHKLPWNVVLLLGSGFALARGAQCSGLSTFIGTQLEGLGTLSPAAVAFISSVVVTIVTQVVSNTATTTLFLPILAELAVRVNINPLYLMIPATVSASLAFVLPVATPPNAIAFSYGVIKVYEMATTGLVVNILCIAVLNAALNTIALPIFSLPSFPEWAQPINGSTNTSFVC